ncbi:myeloid differentiation primary response protein MyD88-like [Amblyomma americanum]
MLVRITTLMADGPIMAYPRLTVQDTAELTPDSCQDVPLSAVGLKCRSILAMRLDVPQLLLGPSGHRDWRGLALLTGFSCDEVEVLREQGKSPTASLLDQWEMRSSQHTATVGRLVEHLMCLERYDVLGATETELRNPIYDAFVCYTSKDWPTVDVLVDRLESLGFRLFLPKRDLKAGLFKYPAFYEVMEKWCRKTIIAFSPHFLQSEECRAQQRFSESIHIGQRKQKLIPVIIKPCELDGTTRMFSKISLCDDGKAEWGWNKLVESIRCRCDSVFVSAPHSCILPVSPSSLSAPSSPVPPPHPSSHPSSSCVRVTALADSKDDEAVVTTTAVNKSGVFRRLGNLFGRKVANSVSTASSGFQSMASVEGFTSDVETVS